MTTARFDPSGVFVTGSSPDPSYVTSVTGSSPQWADASDASYAVSWTLVRSSTSYLTTIASFPTVSVPTAVSAVTVHLRASATNEQGATGDGFYVGVTPNLAGHPTGSYYANGTIPVDGSLHDLTVSFAAGDLAGLQTLLAQSYATIVVGRLPVSGDPDPSSYSITVSELWFDVTYPLADPPPIAGCGHPTLVYPGPEPSISHFTTPAVVVGGGLAYSDDDDATYADHSPYYSATDGYLTGQSRANFPGYSSTADRVFTLQLRAEVFNTSFFQSLALFVNNMALTQFYGSQYISGPSSFSTGSPGWFTSAPFTIPAGSDVGSGFFVGLNVDINTSSVTSPLLLMRVYDLELCWSEVATGRTFTPVLRVFPRSDGRGASSAARVWPRPPTGTYGRVGPGSLV